MLSVDPQRADLADLPAANQLPQFAKRGIAAAVELQADEQSVLGREPFNLGLLLECGAKRFVAEDMFASPQRRDHHRAATRIVIANRNDVARHLAEHRGEIRVRDLDATR